jgi:hypothetical protein
MYSSILISQSDPLIEENPGKFEETWPAGLSTGLTQSVGKP